TTFDEAQPQSQLPEQQEQLTRRRSSAASSCISVQLQQPQLDQDLAEKLARRLQLSDAGSEDAAAVGAVAADSEAGAHANAIDDMLSERRERQRLLLARCGPCLCPQLAAKLATRLEKSESTDSDVSETSFSFIAASPQQQKRNPPPPASSTPPPAPPPPSSGASRGAAADLPEKPPQLAATRRKFNPQPGVPEFSHRDINRLREAFVMYDADGDNFIGFNDLKLMMEKLGRATDSSGFESHQFPRIPGDIPQGQSRPAGLLWRAHGLVRDCYVEVSEINVEEVGVMEAKNFFESKIAIQSADGKLQAELREQRLRRQAEEEESKRSRDSFRNTRAMFTRSLHLTRQNSEEFLPLIRGLAADRLQPMLRGLDSIKQIVDGFDYKILPVLKLKHNWLTEKFLTKIMGLSQCLMLASRTEPNASQQRKIRLRAVAAGPCPRAAVAQAQQQGLPVESAAAAKINIKRRGSAAETFYQAASRAVQRNRGDQILGWHWSSTAFPVLRRRQRTSACTRGELSSDLRPRPTIAVARAAAAGGRHRGRMSWQSGACHSETA
uniref:EF-hand domain-containing protein n=1 Tax=Macrostomum lignano TaxID=282301 RepID=A0A1I8FJI2_9PLAT